MNAHVFRIDNSVFDNNKALGYEMEMRKCAFDIRIRF